MDYAEEFRRESSVLQRVAALTNAGLWKRIKAIPPPKEPKCHWDYLLEEMEWMAKMFSAERVLRERQTKRCAKMIQSHFRVEDLKISRIAKELEAQRRRNAHQVSKMIKQFWTNAETLVNCKAFMISDLARKRSLDEKLSKVLNTSEKIAEEISSTLDNQLACGTEPNNENDQDFVLPTDSEPDVEDTIEQEEKLSKLKDKDYKNEIQELEDENNLSQEELIAKYRHYLVGTNRSLSPDITEAHVSQSSCSQTSCASRGEEKRKLKPSITNGKKAKIKDFSSSSDSDATERRSGYKLRRRSRIDKNRKADLKNNNDPPAENETEESDVGDLKELLVNEEPDFQPSGHTFESTKVTTRVPHLLRNKLREYQHIGLDWLATLYDRNLNGILADEMGLGKTIQTIALLAWLAVEKGNWGPHLIIVPTSLMMNWELEILRWCPAFKIMTYYGSTKERKQRRVGWSVPNSFHICITSYTIAVQDHLCFRRRPWEYLILDEAHNIKNFKSQRWQVLLNFNTKRRLLLTGTPLQNNLMELWSLLHFLMPHVFESHSEFKEWFSNPISEIASGSREDSENIIKRFHKTLRPFMLRRLKSEVEQQMPQKIEHVIKCKLSKRQRHLYDEFMSRSETKKSICTGSFLSVLNVLMQLRKVCNHPDLFEPRQVISSFRMEGVSPQFPKCVWDIPVSKADIYELLNMRPYGDKYLQLDVNDAIELVCEPLLGPVRNLTDFESQKPVINVIGPEMIAQPPTATLVREGEDENVIKWSVRFNDVIDDVIYFTTLKCEVNLTFSEEDHMSQSSFSQSSFSQFDFESTPNNTQDTETTDDTQMSEDGPFSGYDSDTKGDEEKLSEYFPCSPAQFILSEISARIELDKKAAVANLHKVNLRRYQTLYLVDQNLIDCCAIIGKNPERSIRQSRLRMMHKITKSPKNSINSLDPGFGNGTAYANIMMINSIRNVNPSLIHHPLFKWRFTKTLNDLIQTVEKALSSICLAFVFCIAPVCIQEFPEEKVYKPATSQMQYRSLKDRDAFKRLVSKPLSILHPIVSRFSCAFPDPRLVEYDCGKLQVMNGLLRELKTGGHKVLLFTQMTKMLNILEAFLNCQGHIYLRMDGSTKMEQRQLLVDRFNKDPKIFCFLLSTRAGGLGINLTGADTVIFYDSDWNPTIDAQAQDRCHRIGQTRDVHIYRLISENSIEENILKTSNQKRILGEHAIEDGKFNLEFFKRDSFRQLFNLPDSIQVDQNIGSEENVDILSKEALENVLAAAEDDVEDRKAAVAAMKEVEAERNEFSDDVSNDKTSRDFDQLKNDFQTIFNMFNGVEQFVLQKIDPLFDDWSNELVENLMQKTILAEKEKMISSDNSAIMESSYEDNGSEQSTGTDSESEDDSEYSG